MKNTLCLVLFLVACKSSDANPPANGSCAAAAPKLAEQLLAKKATMGQRFELKNCLYGAQSGDVVWFAGRADGTATIECVADKESRDALKDVDLKFNLNKLKLDIVGTVGTHEGTIKLTGCKITPHE